MNKKEKIIVIFYIISMIMLITSCIYTCYINKPVDCEFKIIQKIKHYQQKLIQIKNNP